MQIIKEVLAFYIISLFVSLATFVVIDFYQIDVAAPEISLTTHEPRPVPPPDVQIHIVDSKIIELDRVTAYNAVSQQTDSSPEIASCGRNVKNQIALSQDLFFDDYGRKYLCGVEAFLVLESGDVHQVVIYDTMNRRFSKTADLLLDDYEEALAFGVQRGYIVIRN